MSTSKIIKPGKREPDAFEKKVAEEIKAIQVFLSIINFIG